ncbi:hypothetical protein GP486_004563 [Trichoglossum hirsutum]|uniref:Uncharacterized protein n=1 Tax=Trichoglossum hirsutum TaxID=265104 RepID=A0A9P8LB37_9PEZI|nr:hypothetical protein GP486_004563 [Trichoglossum hirsutum]
MTKSYAKFIANWCGITKGRHWLEELLKATTYVSSVEHDTALVVEAKMNLFNNSKLAAVASNLEDLLFHRLRKEWDKRKNLSSLLEQIQLARNLSECELLISDVGN